MRSLKIYEKLDDKKSIASSLNNIGIVYDYQGNYDKAMDYYVSSLNRNKPIATDLNIIWIFNHYLESNYDKAIDYYLRSLKVREGLGDKKGIAKTLNSIAKTLNNIGIVYRKQGNYNKAIDYYLRSLKIYEELGDNKSIASSLNNIGLVYYDQGNYDKAMDYYLRFLEIRGELGNKKGKFIPLSKGE